MMINILVELMLIVKWIAVSKITHFYTISVLFILLLAIAKRVNFAPIKIKNIEIHKRKK